MARFVRTSWEVAILETGEPGLRPMWPPKMAKFKRTPEVNLTILATRSIGAARLIALATDYAGLTFSAQGPFGPCPSV